MTLHRIDCNGGDIWMDKEAEIKLGDWVFELQPKDDIGYVHFINGEYVIANDIQYKIVAQSSNLSLPNIPYVEIGEDTSVRDAWISQTMRALMDGGGEQLLINLWDVAVESTKERIEENVRQLMYWTAKMTKGKLDSGLTEADVTISIEEKIQSLQSKVVSIEVEMYNGNTDEFCTYWKDEKQFLKVLKVNYEEYGLTQTT